MGGAKNCPETPRQKMIGMMYLVLTAMLALNVSAAIMNGYAQVDDSLHATIEATKKSNQDSYKIFEQALQQNQTKTQEWYNKADTIKLVSKEFYDYVQNFKDEMVAISEGKNAKKNARLSELKKQDDTNVPQQYAIEEGHALELKEKINAYRDFMVTITGDSPSLDDELKQTFVTPRGTNTSGDSISWEESVFLEMPMCACLTVLTKLQNDIVHSEGRAIRYLLTQTDAGDLRVNKFNAYVIPTSDYVIKGNKYSAQIILAAIDSTQNPEYYVNGQQLNSNGVYEVVANSVGKQKFSGRIGYKDQQGEMQYLPFEHEYTVGEPTATISNTDLNIMYRGYNNPFSISVPGVSSDQLKVSCSHAEVRKEALSKWTIIPNKNCPDNVEVKVYASMEGRDLLMGSQSYRIKPIPRPDAYISVRGSVREKILISPNDLLDARTKIVADYGPDALIQARYEITSFKVETRSGSETINGNTLNDKAKAKIKNLGRGEIVKITNIRAKGPDGERYLRNLIFELD